MNLIILDQNFDTLGVVSVFNTLIWDRRYYASGLFELHTPAEFFTLMNTGRYLYRNDRDELGVIREVSFARDAKGTRTAYCKGYFSEELLNGRVLNTQISLTGTPEVIGRKMVDRYVINPTDAGRKIAERIYERHELLSSWLIRLGVSPETAASDACRIEHVISTESFEALKRHIK